MKRKLVSNATQLAILANRIEGLHKGVTGAEFQKAFQIFLAIETSIIVEGKTRSLAYMLRAQARKKAAAFKKKKK